MPPPVSAAPATRPASLVRLNSPTGRAVAMLVGITLAFYLELWWPGLVLIKSDAYRIWLPIKQHMIERLASGELPQWFPYEGLGRPFIGIAASGVFHPYTVLYFFLPAADAHRASTLLSCLLAAIGAFTLGRTLNCSRAGALVAGLAFALSGYVVSFTEHLIYLYSICVLPFFCAALEKALTGSRSWAVVPAVIWATVFLNGDIQTGYYYGFIALFWTAMRSPGSRLEATLRVALIGGLAALLASIQLGPTWVVYVQSQRAQPELFHKLALSESTHPLRLMTVLAAPMTQDADPAIIARLFFGYTEGSGLTESLYLGIPMTGLALIGAWYRRDLRILVLLGGLALLLALGRYGGLYEIFYKVVPLWSAFRYPEKLMGVVSFVVAMLAGAGLDSLRMGKGCPFPWLAVAVLCTGTGLLLRSDAASAWTAASFRAPADLAHEVVGSAGSGFLYGAAVALGVWLIHAGARRGWLSEMLFLSFLITLITLDLARVNLPAYHTGPVETATFAPPLAEALRAREGVLEPGHFRLVTIERYMYMTPLQARPLLGPYGAESVEKRQALDLEINAQFHLETLRHFLPGYSTSIAAMFQTSMAHGVGTEVAARFNVTYYIGRRFHFFKDRRFAGMLMAELPEYDLALFRNPVSAKPRAYLSQRPERTALPVDPIGLLKRPDFLSGEVDVIETRDATLPGPALSGSAVIERYAPEEVRVRVETPQPAVLILLDSFDKGWTATLESGVALPIMRANALVRAVAVPAGTHLVTFSYQTPLLKEGAWASLAGVLLCLGLLTHACWATRLSGDHT